MSDGDDKYRLQVWIPRSLYRRLRIAAAVADVSTTALVGELLEDGVGRREAEAERQ